MQRKQQLEGKGEKVATISGDTLARGKAEVLSVDVISKMRDTRNKMRTRSLFKEMRPSNSKYPAYFTLKDQDTPEGHISMRRKYLEIADPTEYAVGVSLLGDFKHWQALCELSWFKAHVDRWRIELQTKLESQAVSVLKEVSSDKNASGRVQAAKLLVERPWERKDSLRGRPSKVELEGYKKQAIQDSDEVDEDYARIVETNA
jgi:hypothetical protein